MRIGIVDIDSHARRKKWGATVYPNLALCKIAAYHKLHGDPVEWASPLDHYDRIYISKIFNYSPDDIVAWQADEIIREGTGYDIYSQLPQEIDDCQPDYTIYPSVPADISYGFLSRGCPNKCAWCVVPKKEGAFAPYWDIDHVANGRKKVVLMDNNILAGGDYAVEQLEKIIDRGYRIDFNQALDARLVTPEYAKLLAKVKWLYRLIRFGCDTMAQVDECEKAISLLHENGYKGTIFLYTMLHGDFQSNFARVNHWRERLKQNRIAKTYPYKTYPHAQPYRNPNGTNSIPQWQKDIAQWCNKRMLFWTMDFTDFSPRKNFTCKQYFAEL